MKTTSILITFFLLFACSGACAAVPTTKCHEQAPVAETKSCCQEMDKQAFFSPKQLPDLSVIPSISLPVQTPITLIHSKIIDHQIHAQMRPVYLRKMALLI